MSQIDILIAIMQKFANVQHFISKMVVYSDLKFCTLQFKGFGPQCSESCNKTVKSVDTNFFIGFPPRRERIDALSCFYACIDAFRCPRYLKSLDTFRFI